MSKRGTTTAEAGAPDHRCDVQGLRAVAVLLVIGDHAGLGPGGGFVGVDIFLVVSGYLITLLMLRETDRTGRLRIGQFYARRARRILPAATVVLAAVMVYAAGELAVSRVAQLRTDATWSALFAANVHFAEQGTDYFAREAQASPFQHYWSLAVEEQFYLLWPLLLALLLLLGAARRVVGMVLVAVVAASLAWSVVHTAAEPVMAYYASSTRAWELGIGALLAVHHGRLQQLARGSRRVLGLAGLVAIAGATLWLGPGSPFPGWRAVVPVLGTAALVEAGAVSAGGTPSGASRLLSVAPLVRLGDLSYSLYLWHWPLLVLGPEVAPTLVGPRGTSYLLALTLVLAVFSYTFIENPVRRSRLLQPGNRGLVLWPAALAVVMTSSLGADHRATRLFAARVNGSAEAVAAKPQAPTPDSDRRARDGRGRRAPVEPSGPSVRERLEAALALADADAAVPFPLSNVPQLDHDGWQFTYKCTADPLETRVPVCPIGDTRAARTLIVHGDSRAGQWLPALDAFGRTEGYRVVPVIKFGCPPYDVPMLDWVGRPYEPCHEFRAWAVDFIAALDPDVIVLGAEGKSWRMDSAPGLDRSQTWLAGVNRSIRAFQRLGADVVILADVHVMDFEPEDCLTAPGSTVGGCVVPFLENTVSANGEAREVASETGASYLDITSLVCVGTRCPLVVDGAATYADPSHLSVTWVRKVAAEFSVRLARALGEEDSGGEPASPRQRAVG